MISVNVRCNSRVFAVRIILLVNPEGDVIGREESYGELEGEFFLSSAREVLYRHPLDRRLWFAGTNADEFRAAATVWNRYCQDVVACPIDQQPDVVDRLQDELSSMGALPERSDGIWRVLLEQAQDGLL